MSYLTVYQCVSVSVCLSVSVFRCLSVAYLDGVVVGMEESLALLALLPGSPVALGVVESADGPVPVM